MCDRCRHPGSNSKRIPQVLKRFAVGQTFGEIALALGISQKTVEYHWALAKALYNLQCPQDVVFFALRKRWVTLDGRIRD